MNSAKNPALQNLLVNLQVKETALVLIAASILPVLVHTIPSFLGIPIGARLLPIFYAPFIGIIFFRPHVGIIAGLFAPSVNALITGRPDLETVFMLTIELVVFAAVSGLIYSWFKKFRAVAPIAYLIAKLFSSVVLGIRPHFATQESGLPFFLESIKTAVPGLIILLLISWLAVNYKTKIDERAELSSDH